MQPAWGTHCELTGLGRNWAQPAPGTYFELAGLGRNLLGTRETHFELAGLGCKLLREDILSASCSGNPSSLDYPSGSGPIPHILKKKATGRRPVREEPMEVAAPSSSVSPNKFSQPLQVYIALQEVAPSPIS